MQWKYEQHIFHKGELSAISVAAKHLNNAVALDFWNFTAMLHLRVQQVGLIAQDKNEGLYLYLS